MMKLTSKFPFIARNEMAVPAGGSMNAEGVKSNASQTLIKKVTLENNILFASIVNLLANTLDSFVLNPALPDHPVYSRRDWLGVIIGQILISGKCFFHYNKLYYDLGICTPQSSDQWSFTKFPDVLNASYRANNFNYKEIGWCVNVNENGVPYGLLGQSGKTNCLAYQQAIADVQAKLINEPEGSLALATDSSALTTSLTGVKMGDVALDPTQGEDVTTQRIMKLTPKVSPNFRSNTCKNLPSNRVAFGVSFIIL